MKVYQFIELITSSNQLDTAYLCGSKNYNFLFSVTYIFTYGLNMSKLSCLFYFLKLERQRGNFHCYLSFCYFFLFVLLKVSIYFITIKFIL